MEDNAMDYEILIRKAFNCGRHGVYGADADIYRRYERNQLMYETNLNEIKNNKPRSWGQPIEEMAYLAGLGAGKVSSNIKNAVGYVKREYKERLTSDKYDELDENTDLLHEPSFKNIGEAIHGINGIFSDLGLSLS
jgi:hypothetical protein